jgi:hypothetical protein
MIYARNQTMQENVASALAGDAMPSVDRAVYYTASEMQLLEGGICRSKSKLTAEPTTPPRQGERKV